LILSWYNSRPNPLSRVDFSSMSCYLPAESHYSGGFIVSELVILGGINIFQVASSSMS
jgi:hypothetical protein